MKKIGSKLLGIVLLLSTLPAFATTTIPYMGEPLSNAELSRYRGGFSLNSKRFINIGISITTSLNGKRFFNSHIANFLMRNGKLELTSRIDKPGTTNVLQHGFGNKYKKLSTPDAPTSAKGTKQEVDSDETVELSSESTEIASNTQPASPVQEQVTPPIQAISGNDTNAISSIIQNTVDNSVLGISTIVDIDVPVSTLMQNSRLRNRLDSAIMLTLP